MNKLIILRVITLQLAELNFVLTDEETLTIEVLCNKAREEQILKEFKNLLNLSTNRLRMGETVSVFTIK